VRSEPYTSVPSGDYTKTHCEHVNRQNLQSGIAIVSMMAIKKTPYNRLFLSSKTGLLIRLVKCESKCCIVC